VLHDRTVIYSRRMKTILLTYASVTGGQAEGEEPVAPLAVSVSQSWEAEHAVVGMAWLDGPVLALLLQHGPRTLLHLYNQQGLRSFSSLLLSFVSACLHPVMHVSSGCHSSMSFPWTDCWWTNRILLTV
jgi:hypothetical protein